MVHEGNSGIPYLCFKVRRPEGADAGPDQVVCNTPSKNNSDDRNPEIAAADLDDLQGRDTQDSRRCSADYESLCIAKLLRAPAAEQRKRDFENAGHNCDDIGLDQRHSQPSRTVRQNPYDENVVERSVNPSGTASEKQCRPVILNHVDKSNRVLNTFEPQKTP